MVIKKIPREVNVVTSVGMMKAFPCDPIVFQEPPETIMEHLRLDSRFMNDDTGRLL